MVLIQLKRESADEPKDDGRISTPVRKKPFDKRLPAILKGDGRPDFVTNGDFRG
jgi:hypothetical protein